MKRFVVVSLSAIILSACSTDVIKKREIPEKIASELRFSEVRSQVAKGVVVPPDLPNKLDQTIYEEISSRRCAGYGCAKIKVLVTRYEMSSSLNRAFVGILGGSNKLYVTVTVSDSSGVVIGEFDVNRESNPGGYGMYYDQEQATIDETAKGIAETLLERK